ncbi:MAG: CYTH and CHAD domain-containing protein [Comamonadaceae bacterium]|nr:MAG: CYTH and CHAD domain-containing protein [Comamonadaceae bacterium]
MEVEFKFQVPEDRLDAITAALGSGDAERIRMEARYFDTGSGSLAKAGLALRLRREGGRWVQTIKGQGSGPLGRLEDNVSLDHSGEAEPVPDPGLHKGTEVGKLLAAALKEGEAELVERFRTDISRLRRRDELGRSLVEIALDHGEVLVRHDPPAGPSTSPVCELELELVRGSMEDLVTLSKEWVAAYGLFVSDLSKAGRGARLTGREPPAAVKAVRPRFSSHDLDRLPGAEIRRKVIAACLAQVIPNASEVALGSEDVDIVHQLRVGIRRLRTALRELAPLARGINPAWEDALKNVFIELGKSRDRELLQSTMFPMLEEAGGPRLQLPAERGSEGSLPEAVRSSDFQLVLVALMGSATPPLQEHPARHRDGNDVADAGSNAGHDGAPGEAGSMLAARLGKLHRQVVKGAEAFDTLSADEQHRVRKRLKRLRYLAEFVGPLFDAKAADKYIQALTPAQEALGEFNDRNAAAATLRELARKNPKAWFGVGWLAASHAKHMKQSQRALKGIDSARKFWK